MLDAASLQRQRDLTTTVLETSAAVGWTSALVERRLWSQRARDFEPTPTRDLTLVLQLDGLLHRQVRKGGRWVADRATAGALGMMAPLEEVRVRGACAAPFGQLHLVAPGRVLEEAGDALRRAGQAAPAAALKRFAFRDPSVAMTMRTLLTGTRAGLPDLYAGQAVTWLVTHLLTVHAGAAPIPPAGSAGEDRRLRRALALIEESFALPLTLDQLASEAAISKFHFARRFRELTGRTPHRHLEERRMDEARRLLRHSDLSVEAVGRRCGYARPSTFTAAFKRHHGRTPGAFRRGAPA